MNIHVNSNLALEKTDDVERKRAARGAKDRTKSHAKTQAKADPRAELAAQFIPAGSRVLDLSRTKTLERLLPHGCSYQGRDRIKCDGGAACDIASGDFPTQAAGQSDIIVMLGALEQVADIDSFFTHLRFCKQDVIVSYSATDLIRGEERAALGFANHLSFYDLTLLFDRYGFRIECTAPIGARQALMRLTPTDRLKPVTTCSVAVVSCSDDGNFGDRLGSHMINALLPGEADVHHLTFRTLHEARERYDLVVLGTGNSLFQPLLGDDVLDIIGRAKASIGIFGTQYRELMPRATLGRLIERLDTWFARTEDDVLMYGRGAKNVVHLGMAGHSQFKNIMHRKGRQDAQKSKLFGKLAREITVAAKLGLPDPGMNARLRAAIISARARKTCRRIRSSAPSRRRAAATARTTTRFATRATVRAASR
jgi:hypothetical protein